MPRGKYAAQLLPEAMPDGEVWELFHENSKTSRFRPMLPDELVYKTMLQRHVSLPYAHAESFALPPPLPELPMGLGQAMAARQSVQAWPEVQQSLGLAAFASLLHYASGITRPKSVTGFGVDFRAAPSGGGLYPLELFVHAREVEGLAPGLYHYDPPNHAVQLVQAGDLAPRLAPAFVQGEMVWRASAMFFLAALFRRSTFKYRDRGYRFVLLEAGHIAQNINLAATACGCGVLNVGGYFDRQLDEVMEFDGINQSVVYVVAVQAPQDAQAAPA